jgi:hypothetical protein
MARNVIHEANGVPIVDVFLFQESMVFIGSLLELEIRSERGVRGFAPLHSEFF